MLEFCVKLVKKNLQNLFSNTGQLITDTSRALNPALILAVFTSVKSPHNVFSHINTV